MLGHGQEFNDWMDVGLKRLAISNDSLRYSLDPLVIVLLARFDYPYNLGTSSFR
jgi:hypothetical protein